MIHAATVIVHIQYYLLFTICMHLYRWNEQIYIEYQSLRRLIESWEHCLILALCKIKQCTLRLIISTHVLLAGSIVTVAMQSTSLLIIDGKRHTFNMLFHAYFKWSNILITVSGVYWRVATTVCRSLVASFG